MLTKRLAEFVDTITNLYQTHANCRFYLKMLKFDLPLRSKSKTNRDPTDDIIYLRFNFYWNFDSISFLLLIADKFDKQCPTRRMLGPGTKIFIEYESMR